MPPYNDGSCMVDDCTPYMKAGCSWRDEIVLNTKEDY